MSRKDDDKVTLNGTVKFQTARAVLFHSDFMDEEVWLPKSQIIVQIEEGREGQANVRAEVTVPGWLADKNKLE
jgi:hypothetical protein